MKKLHDNYSLKLREAEQWPDRLQKELSHERDQHRIQMIELERRLKENFTTVRYFILFFGQIFNSILGIKY
jgi:hypothetical protein